MSTPDLNSTFGAMFIGLLFATFFQGILSAQAYVYYESFPEDPWKIKSLVAGVWCLDTFHLVLIAKTTYHYLVDNWGNVPALQVSTWELDIHLIVIGLVTFLCQSFFLRRIWLFSNRSIVLAIVLICLCLSTLGLNISLSVQLVQARLVTNFARLNHDVIALFAASAGVDVAIALLLSFYLLRGRGGFERTNSIISRLIQYTIVTGLATSTLAVACLVAFFSQPHGFIYIAMHFSVGRMYTNALLATLNSRRNLRAAMEKTNIHHTTAGKLEVPSFSSNPRSASSSYKYGEGPLTFDLNGQSISQTPAGSLRTPSYRLGSSERDIELHSLRDKSGLAV